MITDTKVIGSIEELEILTDGDIENICKVIKKPGGINPITNVANIGLQVPLSAKNNLKLASFFLKHKTRTTRVLIPTDITLDSVRLLNISRRAKRNTQILWYLR